MPFSESPTKILARMASHAKQTDVCIFWVSSPPHHRLASSEKKKRPMLPPVSSMVSNPQDETEASHLLASQKFTIVIEKV